MSLWNSLFPKESHLGYINCKYMRITTCQMNGGKRRGKIVLHVVHINYKQVFTGVSSISKMSWNKISFTWIYSSFLLIPVFCIVGTHGWLRFVPLSITRVMERGTKRNQPWVPLSITRVMERGTKCNQPWVPTMGILLLSIFCSQGHLFLLIRTKLIDFTRTNIIQILTFNSGLRMPFD